MRNVPLLCQRKEHVDKLLRAGSAGGRAGARAETKGLGAQGPRGPPRGPGPQSQWPDGPIAWGPTGGPASEPEQPE
eukprot:2588281-Pyramimonas_sp.AAC.1